jgi:hypothetical protein
MVFVNDNWVEDANTSGGVVGIVEIGDTVKNTGPGDNSAVSGKIFGYEAFMTIQNGTNAVAVGGTVNVLAGTYAENVAVTRSMSILGPNEAINPNTGMRVGEAIVLPGVTETSVQGSTSGTIFRLGNAMGHSAVTIKGLTIDGSNPALTTTGRVLNGVEINTGAGIINSIGSFDSNPAGYDVTMTVQNNIIKNLERYGVFIENDASACRPAGTM